MAHYDFYNSKVLNDFAEIMKRKDGEKLLKKKAEESRTIAPIETTNVVPKVDFSPVSTRDVVKYLQQIGAPNELILAVQGKLKRDNAKGLQIAIMDMKSTVDKYADAMKKDGKLVSAFDRHMELFGKKVKEAIDTIAKPGNGAKIEKLILDLRDMQDFPMIPTAMDKTAEDYKVTSETGEELVEKAHPGGGTKTELTHSKTDENLVETIVEQQEADKEVAMSVPTGTYAALRSLKEKLEKMGKKSQANKVQKMMDKVATKKDKFFDKLVSIADQLDAAGMSKHADEIDMILQKNAVPLEDPAKKAEAMMIEIKQKYKNFIISKLKENTSRRGFKELLESAEKLDAKMGISDFIKAHKGIVKLLNKNFQARVANDLNGYFEKTFMPSIEQVAKMRQEFAEEMKSQQQVSTEGVPESIKREDPYKKQGPKQPIDKDILAFQRLWNIQYGSKYGKLKEDGISGPKTREKLKMYNQMIKKTQEAKQKKEEEAKRQKVEEESKGDKVDSVKAGWTADQLYKAMDKYFVEKFQLVYSSIDLDPGLKNVQQMLREKANEIATYPANERTKLAKNVVDNLTLEDIKKSRI